MLQWVIFIDFVPILLEWVIYIDFVPILLEWVTYIDSVPILLEWVTRANLSSFVPVLLVGSNSYYSDFVLIL